MAKPQTPRRWSAAERSLGMHRSIARRDFLHGVALGGVGLLLGPRGAFGAARGGASEAAPYPPALLGMRGSHDGSWESAHALRDGTFWDTAGAPADTGEHYDLVVVGAGLSGLSAALFFKQQAGPSARVLLLDNHDDFGGHAKRNEFTHAGRTYIGYGGTQSIDSPAPFSAVARGLVEDLGVDVSRWESVADYSLYRKHGLGRGFFFDRETFGRDALLPDPLGSWPGEEVAGGAWEPFLAEAPLSETVKHDLQRLVGEKFDDPFPGLGSADKKARLARISYADYLTKTLGVDAGVLALLNARPHGLFGAGIDAVPAQDAWGLGYPGFAALGLDAAAGVGMNLDTVPNPDARPYYFHFPDGNATLARLLVRRLVPDAMPGSNADDVVTARADYSALDRDSAPTRIRLDSAVVRVRHLGDPASAQDAEVAYVRGGRLEAVRAKRVILACWHGVIPYICSELPPAQREALAFATKVPLTYTNVLIRNWTSFVKLKVAGIHAPHGFHSSVGLDAPVSVGDYHCPSDPAQPILLHLSKSFCEPGLPIRDQHMLGRLKLYQTPFEEFERNIRGELGRMLGSGGFDPAKDVLAITVNRWPHGYAYQYNSLYDDFWMTNGELPCVRARQPFGLLTIANADAAAYSYTDAAFDHAYRAVQEALPRRG